MLTYSKTHLSGGTQFYEFLPHMYSCSRHVKRDAEQFSNLKEFPLLLLLYLDYPTKPNPWQPLICSLFACFIFSRRACKLSHTVSSFLKLSSLT